MQISDWWFQWAKGAPNLALPPICTLHSAICILYLRLPPVIQRRIAIPYQ